jgi:hypothetical protein
MVSSYLCDNASVTIETFGPRGDDWEDVFRASRQMLSNLSLGADLVECTPTAAEVTAAASVNPVVNRFSLVLVEDSQGIWEPQLAGVDSKEAKDGEQVKEEKKEEKGKRKAHERDGDASESVKPTNDEIGEEVDAELAQAIAQAIVNSRLTLSDRYSEALCQIQGQSSRSRLQNVAEVSTPESTPAQGVAQLVLAVPSASPPDLEPPSRQVNVFNFLPHSHGPAASGFDVVLPT